MNSTNQNELAPGQRWDADTEQAFPIKSIYRHGSSKIIFVLEGLPDWGLIPIKRWAEACDIHYHTARNLMKEGRLKVVRVGKGHFLSVREARRISNEGL